MSILHLENLTHSNGGKLLYKNAELKINKGEHIALVGPNGAGKTTLLNIIAHKITPDQGVINLHPRLKIGYLDQHQAVDLTLTVDQYLKETYQELYNIENKIAKLYEGMANDYQEADLVKALKLQEYLDKNDFETINKKVRSLVDGLGIDPTLLNHPLGSLSGGQRGKVLLAKLLLQEDDFLLLDEPTNFLDLTQVEWLAKFLQNYNSAFLLVSHDRDFINKTCKIIYAIENYTLNRYVGNFAKYQEQSQLRIEQYEKERKGQEKVIKKLETFIAKNAARVSTARMAQSRKKPLDKMEILEKQEKLTKPKFNFKYKRPATAVIIKATNLTIGYQLPLIKNLTFEIREGEKCIVKGRNGIGKTTFLNTIAHQIPPLAGEVILGANVQVAYFKQTEKISDLTPIEYLKKISPDLDDKIIRTTLANFGLKTTLMHNKMAKLSGGEQTKTRLAGLSLTPCSLLILDEPTNHIDILAKEALLEATEAFPGTVLITTHDINFSTNWANKILDFEELQ
ncbi:ABC-F family ATP-binding cassette domain-containing protein [Spiroplasma eriocheiris]|uniref:ABC transporter ATP-binding protein n=1 Tax=Spiroplasma eriocheiris TaxID=315358 RepID=A0A0H3XIG3_9MOLU|nr:ABC-F family ATP-binding cassette domain-containing protein [Spiroplasma eriocheiris]AHF57807.1 ABC-type transport system ATP-binding protein [Spiroplasma eriocheiris CCTCC M 207170]AKM54255.1 ABC transporter ATP-binding protein [Spiroplasma eriocheiris]